MKINIKNLKGEIFTIHTQPEQTIGQLKQIIEAEKGIAAQIQKIIFRGKTAKNDELVGKLGLKERDFLVVMGQIAKPQRKQKEEQKIEVKAKEVEKKQQAKKNQIKDSKTTTSENEAQISQLVSMGFSRQQCINALSAAFNDSARAVEYLINGVPSQIANTISNQSNSLSVLTGMPQFQELRSMIQSDPNSLPQLLTQLVNSSPELYNLIAQHPEEFQQLITEGQVGEQQVQLQGQEEQYEVQQVHQEVQQNEQQIEILPQDQAAITRLSELGFSKLQATQAYFACDKNEEYAANLLFDRMARGDEDNNWSGEVQEQQQDDDNLFG